jgi:hypothetical protein
MVFLAGVLQFSCVGVLLTKEKVVHMTPYSEKKQQKTLEVSHYGLQNRDYAGAYGLPNFWAKFLRCYHMYDLYQAAIIWIWPPFFGKSKFGSPFCWKINLSNCHATSVDFFWHTKFCFLRSVPDPCYVDLLMTN